MHSLLAPARRTRAQDVARWCVRAVSGSASRAHGHSHGGVPCGGHHHSHGPDGPDEAGTLEEGELDDEPMLPPAEPPSEDSGLPVAQRAKNILAANWRGQLSTIELRLGTSKAPRKPAIHGSLVPFALLPGGEPVVFLAPEELHVKNAAENPLASLTVGATDPAALASLRDGPRCVLPRVSVLGSLRPMDGADADYARRRAAAAHAAAAPEAARPALEGMLAYKVNVEDMRWVDVRNGQHAVSPEAVAGALVDPFATGAVALLTRLNGGADAAETLRAMCAAYLGLPVAEARLFGVDRAGISLLARAEADAPWREFRFAFTAEVRDVTALEAALRDMADEARQILAEQAQLAQPPQSS